MSLARRRGLIYAASTPTTKKARGGTVCKCAAASPASSSAALFGTLMGVWVEEKRLRCEGRPCGRGEDPLVDKCCIFWCCGNEMRTSPVRARRLRAPPKKKKKKKGGPAAHPDGHKLKTRPDDRWDVWANETYFGITERCSLYDEKPPDDHTKRDAKYDCTSCPASLLDEEDENKVGCRTMFEGKATEHEVWWPFLFIAVWALPIGVLVRLLCALPSAHHRLYAEAFEDWRARGVVTHVEFQGAVHKKRNPASHSELPAALLPGRESGAGDHWHGGPRGGGGTP